MGEMIGYMGRAKDIEGAKAGCLEAAREANTAARAANTAASNANTKAQAANNAASAANTAASNANTKAQAANNAASAANSAASAANGATSTANTAAENANSAAETVRQLTGTVNQMMEALEILTNIDTTEEAEVSIYDHEFWIETSYAQKTFEKVGQEAGSPVEALAAIATVKPGEIYKIKTYCDLNYYINSTGVIMVGTGYYDENEVLGPGEDYSYYCISSDYSPTTTKDDEFILMEYIVTIPEGANSLFVNSFYRADNPNNVLSVRKPRLNEPSGGVKLLWSGLNKKGSGIGFEFTIPEKCFFSGGKELTLMINGYCPNEEINAYEEYTVGLCFGSAKDFGLTDNNGPYKYGENVRYGYRQESCVTVHRLRIEMTVQKVTDSRYAVCTMMNRSDDFYLTSISAIVPA